MDGSGQGAFLDVSSAVACARDGDTLVVLPGRYRGPVGVRQSLKITGKPDPKTGGIILEHHGRESLLHVSGLGTRLVLEHIMLRHKGCKENAEHLALQIEAGASVEALGCGLTCPDSSCVSVRGEASRLSLCHSQVYEGGRCGIEVLQGAALAVEHCQVSRNGWSGIEVCKDGEASIVRCTVSQNGMYGLHFKSGSSGVIEKNAVSGHASIWADIHIDPAAAVDTRE